MTLLEAVFAVAMLGVIASSLFTTINFLLTRQNAQEQQLAAMELANRLILQFLNDPRELEDDRNLPIRYHAGPRADLFRWEMEASEIEVEFDEDVQNLEDALEFADYGLRFVTMRVWLSEHSGGSYRPDDSPVVVEISRLVNPKALRNPEQVANVITNPELIGEMFGDGDG